MDYITVSPEAINAEKKLLQKLQDLQKNLEIGSRELISVFFDNQYGLGRHNQDIYFLIADIENSTKQIKEVHKLCRRLKLSIKNREHHLNGGFPISSADENVKYVAGVMGRIYSDGYKKMRTPSIDGTWKDNVFNPNPNVTPTKYNPDNKSFRQIISDLKDKYGLCYTGTPYIEGYADFSGIALAQVSFAEIIDKHVQHGTTVDPLADGDNINYEDVFSSRSKNFRYADEICATSGIAIPGLPDGYSASDLELWRKENHFTWDESYINGYLLVPSEIHNNIPHTGLVGIATHIKQTEQSIQDKHKNNT